MTTILARALADMLAVGI